jgi:hypothetical protein
VADVTYAVVAVKLALLDACGTTTDGGVRRDSPCRPTVKPPAAAVLVSVTVQLTDSPGLTRSGLQLKLVSAGPPATLTVAVLDVPFSDAVMLAIAAAVVTPAVASNVADVLPAAMATADGAVTGPVTPSAAETPPEGAGARRVTEQVIVSPVLTALGVHPRLASPKAAATVRVALRVLPPAIAVTVAWTVPSTGPAVSVKLAVVASGATVTDMGVGRALLVLFSDTARPPVGAALVSVTVQVTVPPGLVAAGVQFRVASVAERPTAMFVAREVPL